MSADFTFLTLRNVTPVQPNGQSVQDHYVFTVSSGKQLWTNNLTLNNVTVSTLNISSVQPSTVTTNPLVNLLYDPSTGNLYY